MFKIVRNTDKNGFNFTDRGVVELFDLKFAQICLKFWLFFFQNSVFFIKNGNKYDSFGPFCLNLGNYTLVDTTKNQRTQLF